MKTTLSLLAACAVLLACATPPEPTNYANCSVKQISMASGMKAQRMLVCD